MPQILNVNVPIQIPKEYRLITMDEYNKVQAESTQGRMWKMSELRNWLGGKSVDWVKENILYNPKYHKTIQEWRNHKVLVGGGYGRAYLFKASVVAKWLDEHWQEFKW